MSRQAYVRNNQILVAWVSGAVLLAATAAGDTYFVDRKDDAIVQTCSPIPGDCTLRGAIRKANAHAGSDTIRFKASVDVVQLTISGAGENAALTGDLDITDTILIDGGGQVTVSANAIDDSVFHVVGSVDVTLAGLTIIRGGLSGVVANTASPGEYLALVDCVVGNSGGPGLLGGGVRAYRPVFLDGTTIVENIAGAGGGVYIQDPSCGESVIANSSVQHNSAPGGASAIWFGCGTLTILRSTVRNNVSSVSTIELASPQADLVFRSSTFSGNAFSEPLSGYAAIKGGNGGLTLEFSTLEISETLEIPEMTGIGGFAWVNSTGSVIVGSCALTQPGSLISHGGNLESPGDTCQFLPLVDQVNVADPGLRPLAHYGGPAQSHLPKPGSPLVDDPRDAMPTCPTLDQRLLPRPADGDGNGVAKCDSGAVELQEIEVIFTDGFESGDTSLWSAVSP